MCGTWIVILGVVVAGVATGGELHSKGFQEEPTKDLRKLSTFFLKPILDQWPSSVKQKRCSLNLKSANEKPSDLKLLLEQRKTEALCKYCKKSELRMKSLLCKKCVENSHEIAASHFPYILGNTAENSNEKSAKITNKLKDRKTENPQKLNEGDAWAHLNSLKTNSNVRESVLRLIKSPFVSKQSMKTLPMPLTTKTTAVENINRLSQMTPWELQDSNPTVAEYLADFLSNVPSTQISEDEHNNQITKGFETNLQHESFQDVHANDAALFENSRTKRLKDFRHLTHEDFLNILKEALRSEETKSIEIKKRNSNSTKQAEDNKKSSDDLKNELLNDILTKHVLELSSESDEALNFSEIIGSPKSPTTNDLEMFLNENSSESNLKSIFNHSKIVSKRTTEELTTETYTPTTIQKDSKDIVSLIKGTNARNKFGTVYRSRFNYRKHPRERLQYRNKIWVMEKEPPNNSTPFENLDEILEKIAPDITKNIQITENNTFQTENSTETNDTTDHILKADISEEIEQDTTTENSIILSQKLNIDKTNIVSPTPTRELQTDKTISPLQMFKKIRNQHFLNRHMYPKNPRLKSVYENGKYKNYKKVTELNWDIFNTTESAISTTANNNEEESTSSEISDVSNLLSLINPTKDTELEKKIISVRSTKDTPTQEKNEQTIIKNPTAEELSKMHTITNKLSTHEIIKKVLPTKITKLSTIKSPVIPNNIKRHDIFSKNLNMFPINTNKYKNLPMSIKLNEANQEFDNHDKENIMNKTEYKSITNNDENNINNADENENQLSSTSKLLGNIQFMEHKINLPLILKYNKDGSIELILDKSEICNCSKLSHLQPEEEKYVFKRKTDDNLTKYPLNIFNILDKHNDQSATNVNNYLQISQDQTVNADLKDKFYKYLINEQLIKLFEYLNIPVESSAELHSYIDDLPEKAKDKLKKYLLNSISDYYITSNGAQINQELFMQKQTEFLQSLVNKQNVINDIETTTESNNRISFQIKTEDESQTNNLNSDDNNILKSLIRDEILKEIQNSNVCSVCNKQKCICSNNDRMYFPRGDYYSDEGRVIDKRHFNHNPNKESLVYDEPDGLIKKKYKIANNFINWARDIVVNNKVKH